MWHPWQRKKKQKKNRDQHEIFSQHLCLLEAALVKYLMSEAVGNSVLTWQLLYGTGRAKIQNYKMRAMHNLVCKESMSHLPLSHRILITFKGIQDFFFKKKGQVSKLTRDMRRQNDNRILNPSLEFADWKKILLILAKAWICHCYSKPSGS